MNDDDTPMTVANFKEFLGEFARQLAATTPLPGLTPKLGDVVPEDQILGVHSAGLAEDGETVLVLYDLRDGQHTGAQTYRLGDAPGPIRYV